MIPRELIGRLSGVHAMNWDTVVPNAMSISEADPAVFTPALGGFSVSM